MIANKKYMIKFLYLAIFLFFLNIVINNSSSSEGQKTNNISKQRKITLNNEIDYSIPIKKGILNAVLNLPLNLQNQKTKVAIIVPGSGPETKNGTANVYLDLATHLLEKNISTIRYDKRGIAGSSSIVKNENEVVIEDYVNDIIELIKKAKQDNRFSKVYVLGHSEGSLVSILALEKEKVDGFVSLSGPGRNISEILIDQLEANTNNPNEVVEQAKNIIEHLKKGEITKEVPSFLMSIFRPSAQPYMISWIKYEPTLEIAKIKNEKILILQGDNDYNVSVLDANNLHKANPNSKIKIIKGMTHMFKNIDVLKKDIFKTKENTKKYFSVFNDDSLPINQDFVNDIIDFING